MKFNSENDELDVNLNEIDINRDHWEVQTTK